MNEFSWVCCWYSTLPPSEAAYISSIKLLLDSGETAPGTHQNKWLYFRKHSFAVSLWSLIGFRIHFCILTTNKAATNDYFLLSINMSNIFLIKQFIVESKKGEITFKKCHSQLTGHSLQRACFVWLPVYNLFNLLSQMTKKNSNRHLREAEIREFLHLWLVDS